MTRLFDREKAQTAAEAFARALTDAERRAEAEKLMSRWNCSERTVYRLARSGGWTSGRRTRADKGTRALSTEEVMSIQSLVKRSKRKDTHCIMDAATALDVAACSGQPVVSVSTFNRYLREERLTTSQMEEDLDDGPHINMVSLHPNHVHQFDISPCVQYFFKDEEGKGGLDHRDMKKEFYLGKPEKIASIKRHLLRFVLIDHYSNATFVKYFYAAGERAIDVAEFLLEAWGAWGRDLSKFPFRGLPKILICDRGSATMSAMVKGMLASLGIELMPHLPGNPRAKGAVEGMMRIWERGFESRLSLAPAASLEQLNDWALDYLVRFNGGRQLGRAKRSRSRLWLSIPNDNLRLLPPLEVCRELLATPAEERTVRGNLTVSFKGSLFRVPDVNLEGKKVVVSINPYRWTQERRAVDVTWTSPTGEVKRYEALEVFTNEAGFIIGERTAVFGETYNRHPDTITQRACKEMENLTALEGANSIAKGASPGTDHIFGNHAAKVERLAFISRPGKEIQIEAPEVPAISREAALLELVKLLGRPLREHEAAAIEISPRLTRDEVRKLADEFLALELERKSEAEESA